MNDKQAMIEELKTTWTAFGGLSKEEREFLKANFKQVGMLSDGEKILATGTLTTLYNASVYRLSPDFQLSAERWIFWVEENTIEKMDTLSNYQYAIETGAGIEIPADDVPYVKKCIELHKAGKVDLGEFELRQTEKDCVYLDACFVQVISVCPINGMFRFVRKPAKEPIKPTFDSIIEQMEKLIQQLKDSK